MEEWRDVPGYEGLYQISISTKEGKCRRFYKNGTFKERSVSPNKRDGRILWGLSKSNVVTKHQAAKWIALTYPELVQNEYFEGAEIDHIDTDRLNNHPSNLRWVTPKENSNNTFTRVHHKDAMSKCTGTSKWVIKLSINNEILHFYPSTKQASKETGIVQSCISRCCNGKRKTAGGYVWKYAS